VARAVGEDFPVRAGTLERRERDSWRHAVRLTIFALALLGGLLGIAMLYLHLVSDPLADLHAYYDAGARLNAGLPLYDQPATTNEAAFYRYPPLLAIAFRPLATLPFAAAAAIWEAIVVGSLVATIVRLGLSRPATWAALGLLAVPTAWAVAIGQAQVVVTALMAFGAPGAIALATQLKVLPLLAAVYWIGRRDRMALTRLGIWLVALTLVQLILEPAGSIAFVQTLGPDQLGAVRNISPFVISPILWAAMVVAGTAVAIRLAPTRWGWPAAVTLSVLASPRLLVYMLTTLLAAVREPDEIRPRPAKR
jgi:glycosyl transferase family 87